MEGPAGPGKAKMGVPCVRPWERSHCWDKVPNTRNLKEKRFIWLPVPVGSVCGQLTPGQKQHGGQGQCLTQCYPEAGRAEGASNKNTPIQVSIRVTINFHHHRDTPSSDASSSLGYELRGWGLSPGNHVLPCSRAYTGWNPLPTSLVPGLLWAP